MLIDEVVITAEAGKGGRGAVAFNENMMSLGPVGGTGGNGGNIYAEGVSDLGALRQFRFKKKFVAENGKDGRSQFRDGRAGEDLILKVPVGTTVHNTTNGAETEITKIGERCIVAQGGRGGKGNFHFRSSTNTSPKEFEEGTEGESFELTLELKLIADVGLIGLPNTGKSSLLNALTNAKSKVGNYPFTTLEPNLGAYYTLILADIPGLIEGSSTGRGLGIKFLRHIERTKVLFHLIAADSPAPEKEYELIRKELRSYAVTLAEKKEYVFLSKSDLISAEEQETKLSQLKKYNPQTQALSINSPEGIKEVQKILNQIQTEKTAQ